MNYTIKIQKEPGQVKAENKHIFIEQKTLGRPSSKQESLQLNTSPPWCPDWLTEKIHYLEVYCLTVHRLIWLQPIKFSSSRELLMRNQVSSCTALKDAQYSILNARHFAWCQVPIWYLLETNCATAKNR